MPNLSSDAGEGIHVAPLEVVFPTYEETVATVAKDEAFPLVEEILSCNPKARFDLH